MASPPHCGFGGSSGESASDIVQRLASRRFKSIQGQDHIRTTPKEKTIATDEVRPLEKKYTSSGMAAREPSLYSFTLLVSRRDLDYQMADSCTKHFALPPQHKTDAREGLATAGGLSEVDETTSIVVEVLSCPDRNRSPGFDHEMAPTACSAHGHGYHHPSQTALRQAKRGCAVQELPWTSNSLPARG